MVSPKDHLILQQNEQITLRSTIEQEPDDPGMWRITLEVRDNSMGDTALFVVNDPLDKFLGTASPVQEDGIPVAPAKTAEGEQRISQIRFRHWTQGRVDDALSGVINDLDEYLRSKIIFRDQMSGRATYTFSKET